MELTPAEELRNAARYLRRRLEVGSYENPRIGVVSVAAEQWAAMLERAADRIQELEAHLERFVA